jgi:predicted TPR repeat methyltransferase
MTSALLPDKATRMNSQHNDDAPAADRQRTVTLDEAVAMAVEYHQAGHLDDAAMVYGEVLKHHPDRADVLNFMGILEHQRGDNERALALLRQAADATEHASGIWNNAANVLLHLDREDEAEQALRRSVAIEDNAAARANLGRVLRRRSDWIASEAECRQALALDADCGVAWHNLSLALLGQGRRVDAIKAAVRAEELLPDLPQRRSQLARALLEEGEFEHAEAVYRKWLADEPDNAYVRHQLAACTGQATPERASDAYLVQVFDGFAATFDTKLASLGYCAPQLVADALAAALPPAARQFDIADIGCGTGQCGPLVRDRARRLVGCDLSGAMLEKARQRNVYDEFHQQELGAWLRERPAAFDVIVTADTLIYFGDLHDVFRKAAAALRVDGWFAFTCEALPDEDTAGHRLMSHGRYAHTLAHIRSALDTAQLSEVAVTRHVLRTEATKDVPGWVVTARRAC